jgi:hypothetical protein
MNVASMNVVVSSHDHPSGAVWGPPAAPEISPELHFYLKVHSQNANTTTQQHGPSGDPVRPLHPPPNLPP